MSRDLLPTALALLLALTSAFVPVRATAEGEPEIEYGAFRKAFDEVVGGALKREVDSRVAKLKQADLPQSERLVIQAELAEYKRLEARVNDVKTVESLWGSIKGAKDAIGDLAEEAELGYGKSSSLNIGVLSLDEIKGMSSLKKLSLLSKGADVGMDYYQKIKALSGDLQAIETSGLSPATKRLAGSMTVLTSLMSNFGDKVPILGAFVKAYGDVGGGLVKAVSALDGKIAASEGGQMIDGVHGDRKAMLDALRKAGFEDAYRLRGMRDVFRTNDNKLVIWDPKARGWVVASDAEPGITADELRKRYLFYAKKGNKSPTPDQVIKEYRRTVVLWLAASKKNIVPGESITLTPTARLLRTDKEIGAGLYVVVRLAEHSGFGSGSFDGPTTVQLGQAVRWTAPDNANERYVFEVELDPAVKGAAVASGKAREWVYTGTKTAMKLTVEPAEVESGGEAAVVAVITDEGGQPLEADGRTSVDFEVSPRGGFWGSVSATAGERGVRRTWTAPDKPGTYTITARYEGATSYDLLGTHTAGCEASATVTVKPPAFTLGVDAPSRTVKTNETAEFRVTLKNEGKAAQSFSVSGKAGPRSQGAYWRRSAELPSSVTLEGGAEKVMRVRFTPTDADKAERVQARVYASPRASQKRESVSFSAVHDKEQSAFDVVVRSQGKDGRAKAAGAPSAKGRYAAGATIPLSFQVWGPQRVYCTKTVVEKNKGMRQVMLHSHNATGCSWGTSDGRMSAEWKVVSEEVTWSGAGVKASGKGGSATFVVPDKPGRYTVTASGTVKWAYLRRAPGGVRRQQATDKGSASFTIEVSEPSE